jgi:hypothetical protein
MKILLMICTLTSTIFAIKANAATETFNLQKPILYFKGKMDKPFNMLTPVQVGHRFCRKRDFIGANRVSLIKKSIGRGPFRKEFITQIECGETIKDLSPYARLSLKRYLVHHKTRLKKTDTPVVKATCNSPKVAN